MINGYFDIVQFMTVIDEVRQERALSWSTVFRQTGVYGIAAKKTRESWREMSVQTMATLAIWAGLNVQDYIKQEVSDGIRHLSKTTVGSIHPTS